MNLKNPLCIVKVDFCLASGTSSTCQYSDAKLRDKKYFASPRVSRMSLIRVHVFSSNGIQPPVVSIKT